MRPGKQPEGQEAADFPSILRARLDQFDLNTRLPPPDTIPEELDWDDITTSEVLGSGTFSTVYRVTIKTHQGETFALKRLDDKIFHRERSFRKGATDLAFEAKLLARLNHPNIIHMIGYKSGDPAKSMEDRHRPYFIVLDMLAESLTPVLEKWKKDENNGLLSRIGPSRKAKHARLLHRIESTALGVAKAMEYLHGKGILFRDLKPENIGFDHKGTVRVFDFGVARELHQLRSSSSSGMFTGTPRYMANEVGAGDTDYGLPADVYSFGIVLWQIATLRQPFHKMTCLEDYHTTVVIGNMRPPLSCVKPDSLSRLMSQCWDPIAGKRPEFQTVRQRLEAFVKEAKTQ